MQASSLKYSRCIWNRWTEKKAVVVSIGTNDLVRYIILRFQIRSFEECKIVEIVRITCTWWFMLLHFFDMTLINSSLTKLFGCMIFSVKFSRLLSICQAYVKVIGSKNIRMFSYRKHCNCYFNWRKKLSILKLIKRELHWSRGVSIFQLSVVSSDIVLKSICYDDVLKIMESKVVISGREGRMKRQQFEFQWLPSFCTIKLTFIKLHFNFDQIIIVVLGKCYRMTSAVIVLTLETSTEWIDCFLSNHAFSMELH